MIDAPLDLKLLKNYLRIDGSGDDDILALLLDAAKEYLSDAGVPETVTETSKYKLAVMLHVGLNYENRNPAIKIDTLNIGFQSLVLQLKV